MPYSTLDAFADHGAVTGDSVHGTYSAARNHLDELERLGIDYGEVTEELERQGIAKFVDSWDELSRTVSNELDRSVR